MILSFGELLMDMIRFGDSFRPYPGGAPANFAVACSRLGHLAKLVSSVGRDHFGDHLVKALNEEGVDVSHVKRSSKGTTLAFVTLRRGIPSFSFHRGADADLTLNDIPRSTLKGIRHLHCGGFFLSLSPARETLLELLRRARSKGVRVSFSPNTRPDIWDASLDRYLHEALRLADIVIASGSEYERFSGGSRPRAVIESFGLDRLIITKGRSGSVMHTHQGMTSCPAFRVRTMDTTGSGDAYSAGIACGLLEGMEGKQLVLYASAAAALSVTRKGAMSALPTRDEVRDFLTQRERV